MRNAALGALALIVLLYLGAALVPVFGVLPWQGWIGGIGFWAWLTLRRRRFNADKTPNAIGDRHRAIRGGF